MIRPLRLYFDACCSKKLPPELLEFYRIDYPDLETAHLLDHYACDTEDSKWLDRFQSGGWIVITCDRGRDKKKERLPLICRSRGITHIAFTATLLKKGPTAQKTALVAVWSEILHLDKYPPGTQVVLGESGTTKDGAVRYKLRAKL